MATPYTAAPPASTEPATDESLDVLDWDFCIENPPVRPTREIEAVGEFVGRGRPIPLSAPQSERDE